MRMVEIKALDNGAHRNQTFHSILPDGWAVIPDDVETKNFPFGVPSIDYDHGVPTVVCWSPGVLPEPGPTPEPEPTAQDDTDAMLIDHEYRLTLLELGLV